MRVRPRLLRLHGIQQQQRILHSFVTAAAANVREAVSRNASSVAVRAIANHKAGLRVLFLGGPQQVCATHPKKKRCMGVGVCVRGCVCAYHPRDHDFVLYPSVCVPAKRRLWSGAESCCSCFVCVVPTYLALPIPRDGRPSRIAGPFFFRR